MNINFLRLLLQYESVILQHLDPNSMLWHVAALSRQRTLQEFFALLPDQRLLLGIEPVSVICIL